MCNINTCTQVWVVIFITLYLMSATFFGGCVFFGRMRIALIVYLIIINAMAVLALIFDKSVATKNNRRRRPIPFFVDYEDNDISIEAYSPFFLTSATIKLKTRVVEFVFYILVICGGAIGTWLAMLTLRHKLQKGRFLVTISILTVFNMFWLVLILILIPDILIIYCI